MWWIKHVNGGAWDTIACCRDNDKGWLHTFFREWQKDHPGAVCFIYQIPDEAPKWLSQSARARTVEKGTESARKSALKNDQAESLLPGFAPSVKPNYSRGRKKRRIT